MSCWVPTGSVVVITASHSLFDTPPPRHGLKINVPARHLPLLCSFSLFCAPSSPPLRHPFSHASPVSLPACMQKERTVLAAVAQPAARGCGVRERVGDGWGCAERVFAVVQGVDCGGGGRGSKHQGAM